MPLRIGYGRTSGVAGRQSLGPTGLKTLGGAHCERLIRSIKEEVWGRMILLGELSLRYALAQYLTHYHAKRDHQGLNNQLMAPEPEVREQTGQVLRRERPGGLLNDYHQEAAS